MKRIAIAILAASACPAAAADPMYISDKLVVNVYVEANQESSKVATLDSGDKVEAIEKVEGFTHVRLADNREGWIKSSYLSAQVPAIVRLKELEQGSSTSSGTSSGATALATQLTDENKQLKDRNVTLQSELATLKQLTAQSTSLAALTPTASVAAPVRTAPREREPLALNAEQLSLRQLGWGAGLLALGGAIGFLFGYQALARRIRRKYGSVRIY